MSDRYDQMSREWLGLVVAFHFAVILSWVTPMEWWRDVVAIFGIYGLSLWIVIVAWSRK